MTRKHNKSYTGVTNDDEKSPKNAKKYTREIFV